MNRPTSWTHDAFERFSLKSDDIDFDSTKSEGRGNSKPMKLAPMTTTRFAVSGSGDDRFAVSKSAQIKRDWKLWRLRSSILSGRHR